MRKYDWRCKSCVSAEAKEYRERRFAERGPEKQNRCPLKYAAREAKYRADPAIRQRRADSARARAAQPEYRVRALARRMVRSAVERGDLVRKPCEQCQCIPADAHHDDYNHPLSVRWLCKQHHADWHKVNSPVYPAAISRATGEGES
ncbi:hypothetical protein [Pseudoxanthomonas sp. PXM05]|uniref:hypothetical protein n=1 Tax=Pseudoxanthomonas sp. PXM05 TaxID=2854775 RepID=UPI001C47E899|nr:hypothetical protein [Pseudoxanthomonas sp. PXM05]MBV7475363.1 hypothetical protein [Pseudoxanthomonas sp. PXM05]